MARWRFPIQFPLPDDFAIEGMPSSFATYYANEPITQEFLNRLQKMTASQTPSVKTSQTSRIVRAEDIGSLTGYCDYTEALRKWHSVQSSLQSINAGQAPAINWSTAQHRAYRLLEEWWGNNYYDVEITLEIQSWITHAAKQHLSVKLSPRITVSQYNLLLLELWRAEFGRNSTESALFNARMMAASESACHRLVSGSLPPPIDLKQTSSVSSPEFPTRVRPDMASLLDQPTAALQPCFWLDGQDSERFGSNLPRFLWDIQKSKTVETKSLKNPRYVAISHTWGRWKLDTLTTVGGEGSVPWKVPENSVFNVRLLPKILQQANLLENYVWLDLFCIPQEFDNQHWRSVAKGEIAIQADIFRSAVFACAWLNKVPSWQGLQAAITWLSLCYAQNNGLERNGLADCITRAALSADTTTHLLFEENGETKVSGWFSSLWTLQEICLRPNMLLYDRNWQPLTVSNGFVVPFDHITSLFNKMREVMMGLQMYGLNKYHNQLPLAVRETYSLLDKTGMIGLQSMSSLSVLILGNQRYCESRRAEAIMSVIGAKQWFTEAESTQSPEKLVLGRYPLSFVAEVREKLKGAFFGSADQRAEEISTAGTMLPFSETSIGSRAVAVSVGSGQFEDHPSVQTWLIQHDGAVFIKEAGVAASYPDDGLGNDEIARVVLPAGSPGQLSKDEQRAEISLRSHLASFHQEREKHALVLTRAEAGRVNGILIERQSSGRFIKFGVFFFDCNSELRRERGNETAYQFPPSKRVGWVVQ